MVSGKEKQAEVAVAFPTKRFFIEMLTRDIELHDAILDLLDNCVDGVQRTNRDQEKSETPYEGYWAKISFSADHFEILDNCGGIPIDLAKRYAFMMGRPKEEDDNDVPTIGMYGIGMKRAIFKMGRAAHVTSQTDTECFVVDISKRWLVDNDNWNLPIKRMHNQFEVSGTRVRVEHLREGVAQHFIKDGTSPFTKRLIETISQNFSFIIRKGFRIFVDRKEVIPKTFTLMWSSPDASDGQRIAPYIYQANLDGMSVRLAVGFYKPMLSLDELDEEQVTKRSKEDAGWTIICNDRVVVFNDKTRLTGWGEAGVPGYHSQFIGISGVVSFNSNDAWKLPITTTKRGIDTSSETYLYIKDFMREGLKKFTNYTNVWKSDLQNEKHISSSAASIPLEEILAAEPDQDWTRVRNRANELKFNPTLAAPKETDPMRQVRFSKRISEIRAVSMTLFGEPDVSPGDVGAACFEKMQMKGS